MFLKLIYSDWYPPIFTNYICIYIRQEKLGKRIIAKPDIWTVSQFLSIIFIVRLLGNYHQFKKTMPHLLLLFNLNRFFIHCSSPGARLGTNHDELEEIGGSFCAMHPSLQEMVVIFPEITLIHIKFIQTIPFLFSSPPFLLSVCQ